MSIRVSAAIGIFFGIVFSLAAAMRCFAQPRIQQGEVVGGFGGLAWGATAEQAEAVYRDLHFGSYVVEDSREEPSKVYFRKGETAEIEGVAFDRLHRSLIRKYGRPAKYDERYFSDFVTIVRLAQWDRSDATIVLEYRGPERTNADQLTFELRKGGGH